MKAFCIRIEINERSAAKAMEKLHEVIEEIQTSPGYTFGQSSHPHGEGPMVPVCNVSAGECEV